MFRRVTCARSARSPGHVGDVPLLGNRFNHIAAVEEHGALSGSESRDAFRQNGFAGAGRRGRQCSPSSTFRSTRAENSRVRSEPVPRSSAALGLSHLRPESLTGLARVEEPHEEIPAWSSARPPAWRTAGGWAGELFEITRTSSTDDRSCVTHARSTMATSASRPNPNHLNSSQPLGSEQALLDVGQPAHRQVLLA